MYIARMSSTNFIQSLASPHALSGGCSVLVARLSVVGGPASLDYQVTNIEVHSTMIEYKDSWISSKTIVKQIFTTSIISINQTINQSRTTFSKYL